MNTASPLAGLLVASLFCLPLASEQTQDQDAIELADSVMEAMGGQEAWDSTRHIAWTFFGRRHHVWDKASGDIRIEGQERDTETPYVILMNLNSKTGRAWKDGVELQDEAALAEMLDRGEALWINDSYWLVMPYKLRDPGVTLRHRGESNMLDDRPAEVLELTFAEVGRTPENRYEVYVAKDSGLVEQWDFYANADDAEPGFQIPWHGWERRGSILLSGDRGKSSLSNIAVFDDLPPSIYESPEPVELHAN